MQVRETRKTIEVEGRQFVINKFDPLFGSFIAMKIFKSTATKNSQSSIEEMLNSLISENQEDFIKLQTQILSYCQEKLPAGLTSVVNPEGNIALNNFTAPMAMNLFMQTLMFSLEDFFDQGEPAQKMEAPMVGEITTL